MEQEKRLENLKLMNKIKSIKMRNVPLILILLLYITTISCNSENNITGEWKRIKGGNEGMIVDVVKEKDYFVGRITRVSDTTDIFQFELGDIKWKDIEYIEEGKYKFKDQTKGLLIILNSSEYEDGYLEIKDDTIQVIHNIKGGVGDRQTWIRKK
jgi:hypothetical protein